MVEYTILPTWAQVAENYPYAPGRGNLSNEEWKEVRRAKLAERQNERTLRKLEKEAAKARKKEEKAWAQYEADWDSAEQENNALIKDRSELPNRNLDELKAGMREGFKNPFGWDTEEAVGNYIVNAVERPQNLGEFGLSWLAHTGEEAGNYILSLLGWGEDEEENPSLKPWLEQYLASAGGGAGGGVSPELAGTPFPSLGIPFDTKAIEAILDEIKKPEYKEKEFDKWDAIAEGLANLDFINLDFSKAVRAMNKWSEDKSQNKADVANANEEARYGSEKWKAAQKIALEELKMRNAMQNAQLAVQRWQANQPRALGGNRMTWTDRNGNIHFQQVDKVGEARTVGNNAAMIEMMDLNEKQMKKMTPKKILQRANQAAMIYPDKDKIPFIQGYIMQATQMLPTKE